MTVSMETYYIMLGQLLREMPKISEAGALTPEQHAWIARATALIDKLSYNQTDISHAHQHARNTVTSPRGSSFQYLLALLYKTFAAIEISLPPSAQGAFIPVGNAFDALSALSKVVGIAKSDALIVDPYMDEKTVVDYAPLIPEGISLRLLADQAFHKPSIKAATKAWTTQYGAKRPLEARLAPARTLHDRLIIVDAKTAFVLTQSLNAFASRSPASIIRVDPDTGALKIAAYVEIWNNATPI
jgi:hypothetical protein